MGYVKDRWIESMEPKEEPPMGAMKDLFITVYGGGDEAVAAVQRIGDDWRAQLEQAAKEVEELRLTDEEREVIEWAVRAMRPECRVTLRGLLDRHAAP